MAAEQSTEYTNIHTGEKFTFVEIARIDNYPAPIYVTVLRDSKGKLRRFNNESMKRAFGRL